MRQAFRVRSRPTAPVQRWSPEESARYASRRDYLFLRYLLRDRAVLAAGARRAVEAAERHAPL